MKLSMKDQGWFKQVQAEWHQRLQPHSTHLGAHLFDVPDKLSQTAVDAARLFADRVEALSFFQKGGRVAELGTQAGWYAHRILTQLAPRDLHLFDLDFSPLRIDHPEMLAMPNVTIHEGDSSSNLR